jgi:hypothetical protein
MTTSKPKHRTRNISGRTISLVRGRRYLASREMATKGRVYYDIFIDDITDAIPAEHTRMIERVTYASANHFLAAFNNGATSFEGRVW